MFLTVLLIAGLVLFCTMRPALTAATQKGREFLSDYPTIEQRLPVKANAVIYLGAMLEWNAGYVEPASGAGNFAGFAQEAATGTSTDGETQVLVRTRGGVRIALGGGDTNSATIVGLPATFPEATDDDTVRVETGTSITGQAMGTFAAVILPIVGGGKVDIAFKGAHIT